ncbi:MAG TPA: polysaccharide biosynthesis tyrosine autokinase [Pirellulaceae bacterium]|nr:polysaccharide biosynthesis tyrosine autokinase [Pirellulaceae bacterium]
MSDPTQKSAAAAAEGGSQFRVQTIFIALRCWWKIAAPLGIVLAVSAAAGVYFFSKPQYTASAWLIIRDRPPFLLESQFAEDPKKAVENELELMRSPPVIDPVASIPAVASTPEIARERHPAQALRKLLKIRALGRSDYFVIEFTSEDPERAALIVNEVAKAYLRLHQSTQSERQSLTVKLLRDEQAVQQKWVEQYRANVRELTKQLTGTEAFPAAPNANVVQIRDATSELQSKLVSAEVDQVILKAQVEAEKELLSKPAPEPLDSAIDQQVEASQPVLALRTRIAESKALMRQHEESSANLPKNVLYQTLKADLAKDEAELEKLRVNLRDEAKEYVKAHTKAQSEAALRDLEQRLANASFTVDVLKERLQNETKDRRTQNGETVDLEFVRADYERASRVYEAISNKILSMQMEQRAPSPVEIFQEADPPPSPDGEEPFKKMAIFALGALFVPFGLAVFVEHLYRRVSSRDQLETGSGIHVVGEVTSLPRRHSRKSQAKSASRELQLFEESIDGLRTYLKLVHSVQGMQVLAVTSAVSREGKTSLASQLAISVARSTGETTLLIDGDMRSPDIHRAFDIDRGPGLVDVLKGTATLQQAINTDFSDKLHLLPAGSLSSSPHKVLGTNEFQAILEGLKGSYRHILIDTPPLLPASEALLLARAADAAILCVRRDYSRVDQTVEAFGRLRDAGIKVAGAVLNGIPARVYVYRYGSYYAESQRLDGSPAEDLAT